jgi:hypothetical protein
MQAAQAGSQHTPQKNKKTASFGRLFFAHALRLPKCTEDVHDSTHRT